MGNNIIYLSEFAFVFSKENVRLTLYSRPYTVQPFATPYPFIQIKRKTLLKKEKMLETIVGKEENASNQKGKKNVVPVASICLPFPTFCPLSFHLIETVFYSIYHTTKFYTRPCEN